MMKDTQYTALAALPGFWHGRAMLRLMLADECRGDPVIERHHTRLAAEYEAIAQRLERYR